MNNLIYFKNKDGKTVNLSEMVQVNSKIIKIDESFNFKLVDLFNVEYLDYLSSIKDCIKNLIDEQFVDKSYINELFEVNKVDTIKEIYTKYLNFINKYEISPNAVQNNFDLACKNLLK